MRRPRYPGKFPKKPEHKYKELAPDQFAADVEHIKNRGRTPLGSHVPIMAHEVIKALKPESARVILDLTLGNAGHTLEFLKHQSSDGRVFGWDQDPIEIERATGRVRANGYDQTRFIPVPSNFRNLKLKLAELNLSQVDVVFADLGLSSMQIDQPQRGFTLKFEAPLDFRMNPSQGLPASEWLQKVTMEELENALRLYGDEPYPHKLAVAISTEAKGGQLKTTQQLAALILKTVKSISRYPLSPEKAINRIFQAIRIEINQELKSLEELIVQLPDVLSPHARVGFLSFHSGEDRIVKAFFKDNLKSKVFFEIHGPDQATADEVAKNRRSKSAKFRWGVR
jgi:16S rRNA (cytosine1402-N4)-methyltransferase